MIKLNYKKMEIDGITIYYAKYRKNRSLRLTVDENRTVHLTCPYGVSDIDIYNFVQSKIDWINKALGKIKVRERLSEKPKLKKRELDALKSYIDDLVYKYATLMKADIKDVKLRKMKTEWGNCNYKNNVLTFNTYLYYMSERFIEAIVVHEVTHIFVHGHSRSFYNLVYKYLPDYKERLKEAKEISLR